MFQLPENMLCVQLEAWNIRTNWCTSNVNNTDSFSQRWMYSGNKDKRSSTRDMMFNKDVKRRMRVKRRRQRRKQQKQRWKSEKGCFTRRRSESLNHTSSPSFCRVHRWSLSASSKRRWFFKGTVEENSLLQVFLVSIDLSKHRWQVNKLSDIFTYGYTQGYF